ncbi:MAG: HAMP domain-containing sensor histidine kinase [Ardenticatenia bacterium]|nr:HAMP domain-containing sensor histidine kinase [Ardenticatenia bacterium]
MITAIGFASVMLARWLSAPIRHLTEMADRMAEGDLEAPIRPHGPHEIRRLAVAFETMARRVREMLVQQRQFVDNAAHELRSPLASIRLRVDMLARLANGQAQDKERFERYLRETQVQLIGLEHLVNDLLLLSSVEQEHLPTEPLDLAPLLYELADEMAPLMRAKALHVRMEVPPHLPTVQANRTYLRVAVRNVLDNAIKYTPEGGEVVLRAYATANEVIVEVEDTGPGIPPDEVEHIFDRFYRSQTARSSRTSGVGLGLALVHTIVTNHGGRVDVESWPGKGTCFRLHLPTS